MISFINRNTFTLYVKLCTSRDSMYVGIDDDVTTVAALCVTV